MEATQTFHEHVKELRRRLLYVVLSLGITGSLGYLFRNPIIKFIQAPIHSSLFFTSPAGSFNFVIKVATIVGVFLSLPVIVYNIVRFIEPALPKAVRSKQINKVTLASFFLAIAGAAFGYYVIAPMSLHFFMSYSSSTLRPLITANEYLSFILNVLITFALIFQIPLIVLFINHVKPLSPRKLMRYQKYVVIGSLIVAVLLPFTYDPISQFVLALPIVLMFYLSIAMVSIANRKRTKVVAEPEATLLATEDSEAPTIEQLEPQYSGRAVDGIMRDVKVHNLIGYRRVVYSPQQYKELNAIKNRTSRSIDGIMFAS